MIMERKTWGSLTEDVLLRGVAAFAFLRAYTGQNMKSRGIRVTHGLFSKFATDLVFLSYTDPLDELPSLCGLCLGQCHWGILMWPIHPLQGLSGLTSSSPVIGGCGISGMKTMAVT